MKPLAIIGAFVSVVLFPWPLWTVVALMLGALDPIVPLAVGIFADALYYAPNLSVLPVFTLFGAVAAATSFFVRSRLKASIM